MTRPRAAGPPAAASPPAASPTPAGLLCHSTPAPAPPGSVVVALLGMPNTGKSTLFNRPTGGHAQIANWPGLTVELLRGRLPAGSDGRSYELIDLPGIHDLSGRSEDEAIVQRFLRDRPPGLLLVVVNATQVASQLRLVLQQVLQLLFLALVLLMFQTIDALGAPLQGLHCAELLRSFLVDGLWLGVSTVMSFLPIIFLFY